MFVNFTVMRREKEMPECQFLNGCVFFNKASGSLADLLKKQYCRADFATCARFQIATKVGREKVPPTLFPNMADRARAIIKQG